MRRSRESADANVSYFILRGIETLNKVPRTGNGNLSAPSSKAVDKITKSNGIIILKEEEKQEESGSEDKKMPLISDGHCVSDMEN